MSANNFWLRIFNVRAEEAWLVKKLFLLQFFQGAGIAFFFTASFALFLEKFPITRLPWVMIISAGLLWITGFAYAKLEHRLPVVKFSAVVTLFMTVSMLLFWLGCGSIQQDWFFYIMFAWFNVLYLLNNLEFWGIAALLFDIRQSKRLFGVISAGDIPSKFIGYSVALLLVSYTGTANLIIAGIACMLASLYYLRHIHKSRLLDGGHAHQPHKPHKDQIRKLVNSFSFNTLIRQVAILSFLTSCCMIIINYAFYSGVKEAYHDDLELAKFIALFMAGSRVIAMIIKMIFAGRLIINLGINRAALVTPVVLILVVLPVLISGQMLTDQTRVIYFFGVAAIAVDALRTSINAPALLTLMQPLPTHDRLRAHNLVKGIMDPFANLFSGILLLVIFNFQQRVNLVTLSIALVLLALIWIVNIYYIKKPYLRTLVKTIGSSYFNQEDFSMKDIQTQELIRRKIKTGTEAEIINILGILNNSNSRMSDELIVQLLQHPSDNVKLEAIYIARTNDIITAEMNLLQLVNESKNPVVVSRSLQALCVTGKPEETFGPYIDHPNTLIQQVAISNLLQSKNEALSNQATSKLNVLFTSDDPEKRKIALSILADVPGKTHHSLVKDLMNDDDTAVSNGAMEIAGKSGDTDLLSALILLLPVREKQVLICLRQSGEAALPVIHDYLFTNDGAPEQRQKLIGLYGQIGGSKSMEMLLQRLRENPGESAVIIKALYRCRYQCDAATHKLFEAFVRSYIVYGVQMLQMQQILQPGGQKYVLLMNSLGLELHQVREVLLCLFGCLYHHENIGKVRAGLDMKNKEAKANAMELIEIMAQKDFAVQFNTLYENTSVRHRYDALKNLLPANSNLQVESILQDILSENPIGYNYWTKACSIYTSKKQHHKIERELVEKYVTSGSMVLREIAQYAL